MLGSHLISLSLKSVQTGYLKTNEAFDSIQATEKLHIHQIQQ